MAEQLLTLVLPPAVAEGVEDLLLAHPELVAGFTTHSAAGHGRGIRLSEAADQVSGHAPRCLVQSVIATDKVAPLLDLLRRHYPHAGLYYWLVPILAHGHLAP